MKRLLLASALSFAASLVHAQGTPNNAVGVWGQDTGTGLPCIIAPPGGSATCQIPEGGGSGGGAVTIADGADITLGAKADVSSPCTVSSPTSCTLQQQAARLVQLNNSILIATQNGTALFGAGNMPTYGIAIGGKDSVTSTTFDPILIDNATGGLDIKIVGGSIANTAFGITGAIPAGANLIGKVGIDQTTPGTTNAVAATNLPTTVDTNAGAAGASTLRTVLANNSTIQNVGASTGGVSVSSAIVVNNTTSVAVDASPGTLYGLRVFNNSATIAYLKTYDASQGSTTCGSGTPKQRIMIPANTSGAGAVIPFPLGIAYVTAITRCVTTGIADNDSTAPAASTYIVEADYK